MHSLAIVSCIIKKAEIEQTRIGTDVPCSTRVPMSLKEPDIVHLVPSLERSPQGNGTKTSAYTRNLAVGWYYGLLLVGHDYQLLHAHCFVAHVASLYITSIAQCAAEVSK